MSIGSTIVKKCTTTLN